MGDQSKRLSQGTLLGLDEHISSAGSQGGTTPSPSPAGPTISTSGPAPVPASRSRARGNEPEQPTTDTYGPSGTGSSTPSVRLLSSANKSPQARERRRLYAAENRRKNRAYELVRHAKERAKKKNLPFDLDIYSDVIQQRIDRGVCEVTGLPLNLEGGRTWDSPSLDRIDPEKGYLYNNTRVVCHAINSAMGDWGEQKAVDLVLAILARRKQRSNDFSERLGQTLQAMTTGGPGSPLFKMTWRKRVTPSGRVFWAHTASKPRTSENGYGSWPTTTVNDAGDSQYAYSQGNHDRPVLKLPGAARMAWATPSARDLKGAPSRTYQERGGGKKGQSLDAMAEHGVALSGSPAETGSRGRLNPAFSLWLMLGRVEDVVAWLLAAPSSRPPSQTKTRPSRSAAAPSSTAPATPSCPT